VSVGSQRGLEDVRNAGPVYVVLGDAFAVVAEEARAGGGLDAAGVVVCAQAHGECGWKAYMYRIGVVSVDS
jgi:hypothetical protein